jgi:hypothetical protein
MKTPPDILERFEKASQGLDSGFGDVVLRLSIKQGRARYIISRRESVIPTEEQPREVTIRAEPIIPNEQPRKVIIRTKPVIPNEKQLTQEETG